MFVYPVLVEYHAEITVPLEKLVTQKGYDLFNLIYSYFSILLTFLLAFKVVAKLIDNLELFLSLDWIKYSKFCSIKIYKNI